MGVSVGPHHGVEVFRDMVYNDNVINKLEDKLMNNFLTRLGGGGVRFQR